jgi:hypothetical protein
VKAGTVELAVAVSEHNEPVELQQMSVKRWGWKKSMGWSAVYQKFCCFQWLKWS